MVNLGAFTMKTKTKCHLEAMQEVFELVLIGSMIALVADTLWVFHDIATNGMNIYYGVISTGLISATVVTLKATLKHHRVNYKKITTELLTSKLKLQKRKNKRK
jgi:hypothetical protein